MEVVRRFEETSEETGRRSWVNDAKKYACELGLELVLAHPQPRITRADNNTEVSLKRLGTCLKVAKKVRGSVEMREEK